MSNVLVLGNGFDIAHGLPTSYLDFINFLKGIDKIIPIFNRLHNNPLQEPTEEEKDKYGIYLPAYTKCDPAELRRLQKMAASNSWSHYFIGCQADIQGWIDLEKEIFPALNLFKWAFDQYTDGFTTRVGNGPDAHVIILKPSENQGYLAKLWHNYFSKIDNDKITFASSYCNMTYGLYKEKVVNDLSRELSEFDEMFCIYLTQIVDNIDIPDGKLKDQIKALRVNDIITFNYTKTYLRYPNLENVKHIYHIHGCEDDPKSVIIGVNKVENDPNNQFIRFVKFYQRLAKGSDPGYQRVFADGTDEDGENKVYFYGHSLDVTDADILRELIDDKGRDEPNTYVRDRVEIFYYDEDDFYKKIANLINLIGRDKTEHWLFDKTIEMTKIE